MPRRTYSDAFIDKRIAKIDAMYEEIMRNLLVTPECMMSEGHHYYYSSRSLLPSEIKQIKDYYHQLERLAFIRGFWNGWTLRDGVKE